MTEETLNELNVLKIRIDNLKKLEALEAELARM